MVMEEQQSDMELDSERVPVPQVQKPTEDMQVDPSNKVSSVSRGKPRLRKKALNAAILKQMEFYFSDANLSKDRFLGNLIKIDPYVDISVFTKFNRIIDLTTDTTRIAKALQTSTILSLSEDGKKVCRVTPIVEKENIDDCTVYVQNLPPDADHEMLSSMFSQYGQVAYVSVPRYKSNKKIKGFAFIEFDTPECAKKCIKFFQKKGCVLPSHTCPDGLLSITTFDDNDKDVTRMGKTIDDVNVPKEDHEIDENKSIEVEMEEKPATAKVVENKEKKKAKKRKNKSGESLEIHAADSSVGEKKVDADGGKSKKKKYKHSADVHDKSVGESHNDEKNLNENKKRESNENQDSNDLNSSKKSGKHKKNVTIKEGDQESKNCNESAQNVDIEDDAVMSSANEDRENANEEKKKKRKRKRKSKVEDVTYSIGLQVMAKKDWKHLRNKYLELQRSKMKQLKQHLRKTRWNQFSNYEKHKTEKEENDDKDKIIKQEIATSTRFSFTPGVIVRIEMDKPCTDPKGLKMELKGNSSVKYIDVKESSYHAYVRYDTAEAAHSFAQKPNAERRMTVLEGEEEQMYWNKMAQDREEKVGKKVRNKQRGRNKLLKKAEKELGKHIKFDEV